MHAYHGHDPRREPPLILGHELCGTVVAGAAAGKRVTVNPLITCGRCDYCLGGRNNLCSDRTMIGMTRPGGFAERMSIPASSLIEIPQDMSSRQAALTEPAATALHAIDRATRALARPLPEVRTLVIGGGAVGLLAALLLKAYGCRDIRLGETNPLRREAAGKASGCLAYDPRTAKGVEDNSMDFVLDAVGGKSTRNAALAAVRPGGADPPEAAFRAASPRGASALGRPAGAHGRRTILAAAVRPASRSAKAVGPSARLRSSTQARSPNSPR